MNRRDLTEDEKATIAAALWLVLRDENVRRAFVSLSRDNNEPPGHAIKTALSAYNAIVGVPAV